MTELAGLLGRTLVLVAHPDDESVGCGVLLQRMREPIVVYATDGAPRDQYFWGRHGSRLRYSRLRQEEARAALAPAGVNEIVFLAESAGVRDVFVDQELHRAIPEAAAELAGIVDRYKPQALLTMAYEGGHPDHDACSFLGAALQRECGLPVWEFALYHRSDSGQMLWQQFIGNGESEVLLADIAPEEVEIKRQMLSAYPSQGSFLLEFDRRTERFRPQHRYDYSALPHSGQLNYEAWQWPVTGQDVCAAFSAYLQAQRNAV